MYFKRKSLIAAAAALSTSAALAIPVTYTANDPNLARGFGSNSTVSSTFAINDSMLIGDLDVSLTMSVGFFSTLSGSLTSPDGTVVQLFSNVRGYNRQTISPLINDESLNGTLDTYYSVNSLPGDVQAQGLLSDFDTENILGNWTLTLTDSEDFFFDSDDANVLFSWGITVDDTVVTQVPEPGTLALMLTGGLFVAGRRLKKRV